MVDAALPKTREPNCEPAAAARLANGEFLRSCFRALRRSRIELRDNLTYNRLLRSLRGRWLYLRDRSPDQSDLRAVSRSIAQLCAAARSAPSSALVKRVENQIARRLDGLAASDVDWTRLLPDWNRGAIRRAAILKPNLGPNEKGVILFSRSVDWVTLLGATDLTAFAESYAPVIAPPWSPPHDLTNYIFPRAYPGTVFTLIANAQDAEIFPRLSNNYQVVPLYASSWVNPDEFHPLPIRERDIDIVMVANFGAFKRHFALFRALREMPTQLRVVLVGQDQDGRGAQAIEREAELYGVQRRVEIRANVARREVIDALCRARVSAILSRREGSCTVVAESLFAGTPVAMLEDAHVGSLAFINTATGRLLKSRKMAAQLSDFAARAADYTPRAWAEGNISCHRSSAVLNEAIKSHLVARGERWTQDIAPVSLCPEPRLVFADDEARMRSARAEFAHRFGLDLGNE
jgi:glycosyltransferase involved in cell wall biosynthesis